MAFKYSYKGTVKVIYSIRLELLNLIVNGFVADVDNIYFKGYTYGSRYLAKHTG
jgi:hypothetical protein